MATTDDSWVRDYLQPRYPELVAPYLRALHATRSALVKGALSPDAVQDLLESARSRRTPLGENVASMIGDLANHFPAARDAIKSLAGDPSVHVRINALVALSSYAVSHLHEELLSAALADRSARVRALAADKIMSMDLRQLVPALETAIARESKPELRATLEWERDLLRDGFTVKRDDTGLVTVTCRSRGGVASRFFKSDAFETDGRRWIEECLAARRSAASSPHTT